jgi:hypothetical protein
MPLRISTIVKTFDLTKSDSLYGNEAGGTTVTVRQATQSQNERIEALNKKIRRIYNAQNPSETVVESDFSISELFRVQAMCVMIGCNIEDENGKPLFPPEILATKEKEADEKKFRNSWGQLPTDVANEILEKIYEVNISWRFDRGEVT